MNLAVTILIGLAAGVMVELLLPGHTFSELILAVCLGVAGALLARYLVAESGLFGTEQPEIFFASGMGAIFLLLVYGVFFRPKRGWPRT